MEHSCVEPSCQHPRATARGRHHPAGVSPHVRAGGEMGLPVLDQGGTVVRAILNVIWLVLCGVEMAIAYVLAGLVAFVLIITIPFGIAAFRIAGYVLWPFGRTIDRRPGAG